ncbi:hypothetical protein D910_03429 [Dendroctonus ponderosae]|uniref:G-protein coupled receptors family 1 profile domain-containing protein n=1 Tax=Dendroctonus ponderosae TaxID=77166 RepID=U4U7U1_DENPD|nr:hypothetical protein D910_03429 [Dendroctonus ponderosae]
MLFVIVAEFFICWAPLHIVNTWYLYYPKEVYELVGSTGIALVQLMAYISSCSNPITYCFMNRKFRQTFFTAFQCRAPCLPDTSASVSNIDGRPKNVVLKKAGNNSENSCNDSTLFVGRISYSGRSGKLIAIRSIQKPRIVFSSVLEHARPSTSLAVIEVDPADESFRYKISWIKNQNENSKYLRKTAGTKVNALCNRNQSH